MKSLLDVFNENEIINSIPAVYEYSGRKKIVTYVPLSGADKLAFDLAASGAGVIGNYILCSFRQKGIGTFMPVKGSNPLTGKKRKLSFEEEIRLEMEFAEKDTDGVVEALLQSHPYDEPAYEIYDFIKRSGKPSGYFIELGKSVTAKALIQRLNIKLNPVFNQSTIRLKSLLVYYGLNYQKAEEKAVKMGANALLIINSQTIKLKII
jgi:hypothetical protein